MAPTRRRAAALWALALTVWLGGRLARQQAMACGHARTETTLRLTVNALEADLARYGVVPQLLGDLDLMAATGGRPREPGVLDATNRWLAQQNAAQQAADICLILPDGMTIAASNHGQPLSFVGEKFSYRPYFIDAMRGHPARFYGVGPTSGVRGFFFSAPVRDAGGRIAGLSHGRHRQAPAPRCAKARRQPWRGGG